MKQRSTKSGPGRFRLSLLMVLHVWPSRLEAALPSSSSMLVFLVIAPFGGREGREGAFPGRPVVHPASERVADPQVQVELGAVLHGPAQGLGHLRLVLVL